MPTPDGISWCKPMLVVPGSSYWVHGAVSGADGGRLMGRDGRPQRVSRRSDGYAPEEVCHVSSYVLSSQHFSSNFSYGSNSSSSESAVKRCVVTLKVCTTLVSCHEQLKESVVGAGGKCLLPKVTSNDG